MGGWVERADRCRTKLWQCDFMTVLPSYKVTTGHEIDNEARVCNLNT